MIIRLRSRDGLERIEVADGASVADLKAAIHAKLGIPLEDMRLSKDAGMLTAKTEDQYSDMANSGAQLRALGIAHGDMIFLKYHFERTVEPAVKKTVFDQRQYGPHATLTDVVSKWVRIERQDKAEAASVSFDRHAANSFQSYVQAALQFNIPRGGLLYGTVDEAGNVKVDFIYEPPQEVEGGARLVMQRGTAEEGQVDLLMALLGLKKVGWVTSQPRSAAQRDYILSSDEVRTAAAIQADVGPMSATCVVTWDESEEGGRVHFEAFQVSKQCVDLYQRGWLQPDGEEGPTGILHMRNPLDPRIEQPVVVSGKDSDHVDTDWFLCPVNILDHQGQLLTSFPVENRLTGQTKSDLRDHLKKHANLPYEQRLQDGHLLLWLAKQANLELADVIAVVECIKGGKPLLEGYRVIIDSIAGV